MADAGGNWMLEQSPQRKQKCSGSSGAKTIQLNFGKFQEGFYIDGRNHSNPA